MPNLLPILIFIRPFISSLAFPNLNSIYSFGLIGFLLIWIVLRGLPFKKIKSISYPLILFIFALALSTIFSRNMLISIKELYKYISGILLFLITISLSDKYKNLVIQGIIFSGTIISILAIYQYLFGFQHLLNYLARQKISDSFILDYVSRRRVFFPFVTPNILAGYLAMIIPLTLTSRRRDWFIIPLCIALLLTKSLGAFLAILLAIVIYFSLQGRLQKRKVLFLLGLLLVIVLVFIARTTTQKQHTQPIFSTLMRLSYWRDTLRIIKASPWVGVGLGNFNLAQSRYAHNSYLQIWAEMGILGIISFLWLIMIVFKSALQIIKEPASKTQLIGIITASAVFLLHNFFDFSLFLPEVALIWWIITGLCFWQSI